ncbi:MAG: hypothetical protein IT317_15295 [Anaerolineales bacterium]|nr:hypothetical protein [Anaerolineales bacterium]
MFIYGPRRRARRGLRVARLALCLVLAACGPTGPSATATPAANRPTAAAAAGTVTHTQVLTPSATPEPTALPSPTPSPTSFTIGLAELPGSLDPANALNRAGLLIARHLYDGLTAYAPGGTLPIPALAESWTISPDALTWTFRLRPGASFSDGAPVTADAVRLNFERWLTAAPPGHYAFWRAVFGGFAGEMDETGQPLSLIAGVTAPDPATLVLTLNRPDATLANSLAMPSFGLVNPVAFANGAGGALAGELSAGAGPYVLSDASQPGLVRLTRNLGYWNAAALAGGPDELVFKTISDNTQRLLALQTGEIEAMSDVGPDQYLAAASPARGTRLVFDPSLSVLYLGFNQAHAPWGHLDCRLAVSQALDRDRYVAQYFPGDAQVAAVMQPPAVWGYPAQVPALRYDPAAARAHWQACLAAAVTIPVSMTLFVPPLPRPYLPDPAGLGAAVQVDLATLGITLTVQSPDWQTAWLPAVHTGQADLFLLGWTGINGDPDAFLCPLFCGFEAAFAADDTGRPVPPDAELLGLLQDARTANTLPARERLYAEAHARVAAGLPAVPLAYRQTAWAIRLDVQGYTPSPIDSFFGLVYQQP